MSNHTVVLVMCHIIRKSLTDDESSSMVNTFEYMSQLIAYSFAYDVCHILLFYMFMVPYFNHYDGTRKANSV